MDDQEELILTEMGDIYALFCMPVVIVDLSTGKVVSIEYVWRDDNAQQLFEKLIERIQLIRKYQKRKITNENYIPSW